MNENYEMMLQQKTKFLLEHVESRFIYQKPSAESVFPVQQDLF